MFPPFYKGTTDYMDRFIDEQDSSRDRSSSPNFYSLMFGGSDGGRKGLSLYPGASSKSSFHLGQSESNGQSAEPVINVSNSPLSGTTDYMDRFIDEQDSSRDRSSSPNFYSLMFGGSDGGRKGLSLYPGASSKSSFHLGQSESNGQSAEPVINVSNSSPLSTPSATSAPVQSSQSLASPTNGGRFPPLGTIHILRKHFCSTKLNFTT